MSEEKKSPVDANEAGKSPSSAATPTPKDEVQPTRPSLPAKPIAIPLSADGKPLQPQVGPDGKIIKGPPLGPDGKPLSPPTGPDGKPLPPPAPPPIIGPDGKEVPRPTDAQGHPLPIYVTPEGKPIFDNDGKPIALKFDEEGLPLPLEVPPPPGVGTPATPEDNFAKFSLWTGVITLIVRLTEIVVISILLGKFGTEGYLWCFHQGFIYLAGIEIVLDALPIVAWFMKKHWILQCWVGKNCISLIVAITLIVVITQMGCMEKKERNEDITYGYYDNTDTTSEMTNYEPTSIDYIVLGYSAIAAVVSICAMCCLQYECQCSNDGRLARGGANETAPITLSETLEKRQMDKLHIQKFKKPNQGPQMYPGQGQQIVMPQQQQQMAPQNQMVMMGQPQTVIMSPMMGMGGMGYGYNPMMAGRMGAYGYGYGGMPYYGGGMGYGHYYSPYYDSWDGFYY